MLTYEQAVAAFFAEPPGGTPRTDLDPTPSRRLREAIEPIAMVSVWSPEVNERHTKAGLDFLTGYIVGRAAPLGLVPTDLVVSAFGVFSPGVIASAYETGLATTTHAEVLAALEEGTVAALHRLLGSPGREVEEVVAVLRAGLDRADLLGRPLFSGLHARDWPPDAWARLWHAATLLREYRGDSHLAACVAAGLGPIGANLLTEAHVGLTDRSYTASRGWRTEEIDQAVLRLVAQGVLDRDGAITDRGRALRDEIENATERALEPVMAGIGGHLDLAVDWCRQWASRIVEGGSFPPDPFKRAAG